MPSERLKSPRLRLFVALDLPAGIRAGIDEWREREFGRHERVRLPPAAGLHMTLAFFGYQYERDLERLIEAATGGLTSTAPELRFLPEPVGLPRGRPRLYALEATGEGALSLVEELHRRLEATRLWRREKRPFWPHLTIAKMRPERRGSKRAARLPQPPAPLPEPLITPFLADRLTLFRSVLRPQGAEYIPVAEVTLEQGSGAKPG